MYSKTDLKQDNIMKDTYDQNHLNPPLTKVSLRANQLRGSIILGNYGVRIFFSIKIKFS